jgi:hypothetical protein
MSVLFGIAAVLVGATGIKVERPGTAVVAIAFAGWVAVVAILAFASMRFGGVL